MPASIPLHRRIVWLVVFLMLIGLILLFSATGVMGQQRFGSEFYYVTRQASAGLLGLMLMVALAQVRYQVWRQLAGPLMGFQLLLVAATLFTSLGHNAQGATRWLHIGAFTFQPSELAKVTLTIYFAALLARRKEAPLPVKTWILALAPIALLLLLIFRQPDLGTTVLLTLMLIALLFLAGMRPKYLLLFLGTGGSLALYAMLHSPYRRRRVLAFLNPWDDPQGSGFQTIQSFLSFHSGKIFGVGLGNGNSKLFYLPEVHTDFIFSLVGEELGFVGTITLLGLFLYLAYLLFRVAFQAKDTFGCYLGFGFALSIVLQIAVNLGGVTGLLPVKGLPLPFLSWGRSALIVNLMLVGILLNIVKQSPIIPKKKE